MSKRTRTVFAFLGVAVILFVWNNVRLVAPLAKRYSSGNANAAAKVVLLSRPQPTARRNKEAGNPSTETDPRQTTEMSAAVEARPEEEEDISSTSVATTFDNGIQKDSVGATPTVTTKFMATTTANATSNATVNATTISNQPNDQQELENESENAFSKITKRERYASFQAPIGILSERPWEEIAKVHAERDSLDHAQRCRRYTYTYNKEVREEVGPRRIFYGATMADEPWEMLEIVAAESYGLLDALVLVEPDTDVRTGKKRKPLRLEATNLLRYMFGTQNVTVIEYKAAKGVHGDLLLDLMREEIVKAWKDMGMTPEDVAYMSSLDDMFSRDYLLSLRYCEMAQMKYDLHFCLHHRVKSVGKTQVFEMSPECISRTKKYEHPDAMIGACLEAIGNTTRHREAERIGTRRAPGWTCENRTIEGRIMDQGYPLWSGTDLRELCGGRPANMRAPGHQQYSAFKFRHWFTPTEDVRASVLEGNHAKGSTSNKTLYEKSLDDMDDEDLRLTYRCLHDIPDDGKAMVKREGGGFSNLNPFTPIYLEDEAYRHAVHERAIAAMEQDDANYKKHNKKKEKR